MSGKLYSAAFRETLRTFRWAIAILLLTTGLLALGSVFSGKLTREIISIRPFFAALKETGDLHVYRQVVSDYGEYWIDKDGRVNAVYGKRSVKFVSVATVDAVVPLDHVRYEVSYAERKISITLPSPIIQRANIDEELSYVWESS
ncbi:MAG: DUF4230 domain-containing protein, partial [Gammaproteobacteria bacterium]|nr:DUF4230 domain-containing protein [Gammaproteobacteria bacterium]